MATYMKYNYHAAERDAHSNAKLVFVFSDKYLTISKHQFKLINILYYFPVIFPRPIHLLHPLCSQH